MLAISDELAVLGMLVQCRLVLTERILSQAELAAARKGELMREKLWSQCPKAGDEWRSSHVASTLSVFSSAASGFVVLAFFS